MANRYQELRRAFQFLDCAVRQREVAARCRDLPAFLQGRPFEPTLRDYLFCLMLVTAVAQLEADLEALREVPHLAAAGSLSARLRLLQRHFHIAREVYEAVGRIREARNRFVHEGVHRVDPGCTRAELPDAIVTFLQRCRHPDYS